MKSSILISSFNRLNLFRRTLKSIVNNPPKGEFEVIVADDRSTQNTLHALQQCSFPWTFIKVDTQEFTDKTGIKKFWNCPALTNNIAFSVAKGDYIFQMGNEIIAWKSVLSDLLDNIPKTKFAWCVSKTFDIPLNIVNELNFEATNLTQEMVDRCSKWLLSNDNNVPNYLSVFTRETWEELKGYDERYMGGIGNEDTDFMRRAMKLPNFSFRKIDSISLHQYHGGVNHFYRPLPEVITEKRLAEGVALNNKLFNDLSNKQTWPPASFGIKEIIRSENTL